MSYNNSPRIQSPPMGGEGRGEGGSDAHNMCDVQEHFANDIAIRVRNVSKCYQIYSAPRDRLKQFVVPRLQRLAGQAPKQYFREFWALKDISFEIMKGETLGIIGRNGSGKSTLLQIICGTLSSTTGSVETNGRIAALLELGSGFSPEFTGRENVYMNAAVLGLSKEEVDQRFDHIAAFADIGEFMDQPVKTYSSGMVVRLAFSVSVNVDPDILIVDEALAVGDAAFQFKCLERLDALTKSGTTLLFVSHSMDMVKTFCDRVIYLHGGCTKASGAPEDMAELYLFDLRSEQQQSRGMGSAVVWKPPLYSSGQAAFGTGDGRIVSAEFTTGGGQFSGFVTGEQVTIVVDAELMSTVQNPCLSVLLQDRKMLQIAGQYFRLLGTRGPDGVVRVRAQCSFPAKLSKGRYFITLRLEDRTSEDIFFPLDKQTGLMSFEVLQPRKDFLATVDLGMQMSEVSIP